MRPFIVALILSLLVIHSLHAQQSDEGQAFIKKKTTEAKIYFFPPRKAPYRKLFKHIEVRDFRGDTTRMGFVKSKLGSKTAELILPACEKLTDYLNKGYTDANGEYALLVAINKLWFYRVAFEHDERNLRIRKTYEAKLSFRAEAYLKTGDALIPLTYLDTTAGFMGAGPTIASGGLVKLMAAFMDKVSTIDFTSKISTGKRVTYARFEEVKTPVHHCLADTVAVLQKGVYASLADFKNNKPTIDKYRIETDKNGQSELFLEDEKGNSYLSRKVWGYSDGTQAFIMMDGNLFPLLHVDKAWYIWGSCEYRVKNAMAPLAFMVPGSSGLWIYGMQSVAVTTVDRKMSFFKIDIDSGEIFY